MRKKHKNKQENTSALSKDSQQIEKALKIQRVDATQTKETQEKKNAEVKEESLFEKERVEIREKELKEKYDALGLFSKDTVFLEVDAETEATLADDIFLEQGISKERLEQQLKEEIKEKIQSDRKLAKQLKPQARENHDLAHEPSKENIKQQQLELAFKKDRKQAKWRRKKNSFVKGLWGQIVLPRRYRSAMLSIAVLLFFVAVVLLFPAFKAEEIRIEGLYQLKEEQVLLASGLKQKQHLLTGLGGNLEEWLSLRYGKAEKLIQEAFTEVESVKIQVLFPGKIQISLLERVPLAYLEIEGAYAQIDKKGYVMKISKQKPEDAPILVGRVGETIKTGQKISYSLRSSIGKAMLVLYEILKLDESAQDGYQMLEKIEGIRILGRDLLLLTLQDKENAEKYYQVRFSTEALIKENSNWLRQALKSSIFTSLGTGVIDLSSNQKIFLPVRNILPYEREDLKVDELSFLTNPILIEEETTEKNQTKESTEETSTESTSNP